MSNLYICYTKYQFLITLLKVNENDDNTLLILFDLNDVEKKRIEKYNLFSNILFGNEFDLLFFKPSKIIRSIKYYRFFKTFSNIYLFLDHRVMGHFLNRFKIKYHLLEDGYDFYKFKIEKEVIFNSKYKNEIYNFFFKPKDRGCGDFVIDIEVNDKKTLQQDIRYQKMIEVSRRELFKNITKKRKRQILNIFDVIEFNYIKDKGSILILTQPLWQDKFDPKTISSESEQIDYYKNIVDEYKKEYNIYFKIHPRDTTDYSKIKDVIFLDKNIPMELYELIGDYVFDIGIAHSSSVLDYLNNVKERKFLNKLKQNYE